MDSDGNTSSTNAIKEKKISGSSIPYDVILVILKHLTNEFQHVQRFLVLLNP